MLRLRPTVISFTRSDVTEAVHRRRFCRFLECDDDAWCIAFTPAKSEAICSTTESKPSSSRIADRKAARPTYSGTRDGSVSPLYSRVRPLVADLPVPLVSDKGVKEDVSLPFQASDRRGRRQEAKVDPQQGSAWAPQLCLRPKLTLSATPTTVIDIELGNSTDSHDSLENSKQESPDAAARDSESRRWSPEARLPYLTEQDSVESTSAHRASLSVERANARLKREPGPSTSRRISSPALSAGSSPPPALSHRASPKPFNGSDFSRGLEGNHGFSSPPAASRTPDRVWVYNHFLPASSQHQTPLNLSDARHQSQLQGSYTAPARRRSPQPTWTPTATRSRRGFRGRELSPPEIQRPGFTGLYGGMENTDDKALIEVEEMAEMRRSWASASHSLA